MTLEAPKTDENPGENASLSGPEAKPDIAVESHVCAARSAFDVENYDGAIAACERLLADRPGAPEALLLLGLVSWKLDEPVQAVDLLRRAHDTDPDCREYADALATIMAQLGDSTESLYYAKLSTILAPHPLGATLLPAKFTEFFKNLNFARPHTFRNRARKALERGSVEEAIDLCNTQLELTPNEPETLRLIAAALYEQGQITSAVSALQAVIHVGATAADYDNLAGYLAAAGRFDEALLAHEMAVQRRPDDPRPAQSRLRSLARMHGDGETSAAFAHACRTWFETFGPDTGRPPAPIFANSPDPGRRLRVGYVGAGLHAGDLAPLLEPVLARHDRNAIETYVYADDARQDPMTESLMRHVARWTDLRHVDPETAAEIMRGDGIDIAVDLRGHGPDSRLLTFLYRPAPVRLGWLGVRPATPDSYDAHLADGGPSDPGTLPVAHPVTLAGMPAINPAPPLSVNGHATFGVLAPLWAIGHASVATWKAVLDGVPDANLLVANYGRADSETVERIHRLVAHVGLSERITVAELDDTRAPRAKFMDYIDIALDTMPHSCFAEVGETLWMGVPALAARGSAGARALTAAGRDEWIYDDPAQLRETAIALAGNAEFLHECRQKMRLSLADTPLFDAAGFTRELEAALRTHWTRWCDAGAQGIDAD